MKKQVKVQSVLLLKGCLLAIFLFAGSTTDYANLPAPQHTDCIIEGLHKTGSSTGCISFSWDATYGATSYKVFYIRLADNYVSAVETVYGPSISFSGLESGAYRFYFAAVCGNETLQYIGDEWIIL